MEAQYYLVEDVYLYQDYKSAILLETNEMRSVGKGSWHLKIKYFFITDNIKENELNIIHYQTEDMIVDFYTQPLHGSTFTKVEIVYLESTQQICHYISRNIHNMFHLLVSDIIQTSQECAEGNIVTWHLRRVREYVKNAVQTAT